MKLTKKDREMLAAIADSDNPLNAVYYVPGREHYTNSEARTRWSFKRYKPATVGFKTWVRVTAPVNRLVEAGLVSYPSNTSRCRVIVTQAGRDLLTPTVE